MRGSHPYRGPWANPGLRAFEGPKGYKETSVRTGAKFADLPFYEVG